MKLTSQVVRLSSRDLSSCYWGAPSGSALNGARSLEWLEATSGTPARQVSLKMSLIEKSRTKKLRGEKR